MKERPLADRTWSGLAVGTIVSLMVFVAAEYLFFLVILPRYRNRVAPGLVGGIFRTCHYGILLSLAAAGILAAIHGFRLIRSRNRP